MNTTNARNPSETTPGWGEEESLLFLDYGRYFVPQRQQQIETICSLIPPCEPPSTIVELCCGQGLLAAALLKRLPAATVQGYDGSDEMLSSARRLLAPYGERFSAQRFDLASRTWRSALRNVHAVVSSLAIHHLDAVGKQQLFQDVYAMLKPDGVFVIADVVEPKSAAAWRLAAQSYDEVVHQQALAIDGDLQAFDEFQRLQWNMFRYFDPSDYDKPSPLLEQLGWLQAVGFSDVDVYWMLAGHAIFGATKPL
jgi:tRNA (cmo5U34)-methyltransferase